MAEKKKPRIQTDGSRGTEEKLYTCEICAKEFRSKSLLTQHKVVHSSKRPYECKECGKTFKAKGVLTNHTVLHYEERNSAECNTTLQRKVGLEAHKVKNSKCFLCEVCDESFRTKYGLSLHQVVHSETRPYRCSECNKTFKLKNYLYRHKVVHSSEKPHKCDHCGTSFKRRVSLGAHKMTHQTTRETPCTCEQCGIVCKDKMCLTVHKRSHAVKPPSCRVSIGSEAMFTQTTANSVTTPFSCQLCGLNYTEESSLRRHLMTHTDNTTLPQEDGLREKPDSASTNVLQNSLSALTPTMLGIPQTSRAYEERNSNVRTDHCPVHKRDCDALDRQDVRDDPWIEPNTTRQTSETDGGAPVTIFQNVIRPDQLGECHSVALNSGTESIPYHHTVWEGRVSQESSKVHHISQRHVERGSADHGRVSPQIPPEILAEVNEMKAGVEKRQQIKEGEQMGANVARKTTQDQTSQ